MAGIPLSNEWYNVTWVTVLLFLLTLGDILVRIPSVITKNIYTKLILTPGVGPAIVFIAKALVWLSIALLVLDWYLWYNWAFRN